MSKCCKLVIFITKKVPLFIFLLSKIGEHGFQLSDVCQENAATVISTDLNFCRLN